MKIKSYGLLFIDITITVSVACRILVPKLLCYLVPRIVAGGREGKKSVKMSEIPSKVEDRKYIRLPKEEKVVDNDDEWSRCGKWILFNLTGELSWVDEVWKKLQVLLNRDSLLMIKASTAAMVGEPGVILCYTRPGEEEIEHMAKEIRKVVHYEACMYYKINSLTENKINLREGHMQISQYMHSFKGFFYKKVPVEFWVLANDADYVGHSWKFFSSEMNINDYKELDFTELPSKTEENVLEMTSKWRSVRKKLAHTRIYVKCRVDEAKNILSEADRLWIVGKRLIDEGTIDKVKCEKDSITATIGFFLLDKLNLKSSVKFCDKIYNESKVYYFMNILIDDLNYRYTPEKELYEGGKFIALDSTK